METPLSRVVILGARGRMGRELLAAARGLEGVQVVAALVSPGHPDAGAPVGPDAPGLTLSASLDDALAQADVLIDFTRPESTAQVAAAAAAAGVALVVGTTGLSADHHAALSAAAAHVPVVFAPNMSVGVNVMLGLLRAAVAALGDGYDIEVLEAHHRHKADAPSGTALRIAQTLADAHGWDRDEVLRAGRQGHTGARPAREIGMQVIRGGDVAGDHTVFFLGDGERLEITHRASSRRVFASGALRAARWLRGRAPGLYDMSDVLGTRADG